MKNGILLLCALSMFGCAQNNIKEPAGNTPVVNRSAATPEAHWQNRQRVFARMKEWGMDGRVGLQLRGQSWSFGMKWKQQAGGMSIMDITNPLTGAVMANIRETGSQVVLKAADGKQYKDTDAERLLERQLKLKFPLNDMRYWARAIPTPDSKIEAVKLDRFGRPMSLQQKGWVIKYLSYKGNQPTALPAKMSLEKAAERVKAKVVAKKWQTRF
ncbi:MAG: lipoprotein insertase outer membrane protein LolB [Thiolinea sp.]